MVLVAGATGLVGGEVCRRLRAGGGRVRALVRESSAAEKVDALEKARVEVVRGDLQRRSSLDDACGGAQAIVSAVSAMPFSWQKENTITGVDEKGQHALIEAARAAGCRRFVFVSFPDDPGVQFPPLSLQKLLVDEGRDSVVYRPKRLSERPALACARLRHSL